MPALLTSDRIDAVIAALPPQGRIMLRLLLLQYLDPTDEDIHYIAADQPDPRRLAGDTRRGQITQDSLRAISDRIAEYRDRLRRRRERFWLITECLRRQIALTEGYCRQAEALLAERFGLDAPAIEQLKRTARTAVHRPALRELDAKWEQDEIDEEAYRRGRLPMEYQLLLRKLERERRRLDNAMREQAAAHLAPLQDHEVAHVWGIPNSTLAARKVKSLHQYLQSLQASLQTSPAGSSTASAAPPVDLWKETFLTLAERPVERSVATYDGLERTETLLMEKITGLTHGTLPEDAEGRFWLAMTQEMKHAGEYGNRTHSLFALQRYYALLSEVDDSPEGLEAELLARVSPRAKAVAALPEPETTGTEGQPVGEMTEHVLRSFIGEDHTDTRAKR